MHNSRDPIQPVTNLHSPETSWDAGLATLPSRNHRAFRHQINVPSLSSLSPNSNVAIIGASGGIGAEFLRQLCADARVQHIHAWSRSEIDVSDPKVRFGAVDLFDETSIREAAVASSIVAPLDAVFVTTGVLHDASIQPEKSIADICPEAMLDVLGVNTIGPALVAKHFLPLMRRDAKTVFAALSARVGSISDNRLGGWTSYRMSKAALNMLIKTISIEHARRFPQAVVVGLHPGTVDTDLSKPFQRRVPADQLFTTTHSVNQLLQVIDRLTPADTGRCFAWDGQVIEP